MLTKLFGGKEKGCSIDEAIILCHSTNCMEVSTAVPQHIVFITHVYKSICMQVSGPHTGKSGCPVCTLEAYGSHTFLASALDDAKW